MEGMCIDGTHVEIPVDSAVLLAVCQLFIAASMVGERLRGRSIGASPSALVLCANVSLTGELAAITRSARRATSKRGLCKRKWTCNSCIDAHEDINCRNSPKHRQFSAAWRAQRTWRNNQISEPKRDVTEG